MVRNIKRCLTGDGGGGWESIGNVSKSILKLGVGKGKIVWRGTEGVTTPSLLPSPVPIKISIVHMVSKNVLNAFIFLSDFKFS